MFVTAKSNIVLDVADFMLDKNGLVIAYLVYLLKGVTVCCLSYLSTYKKRLSFGKLNCVNTRC